MTGGRKNHIAQNLSPGAATKKCQSQPLSIGTWLHVSGLVVVSGETGPMGGLAGKASSLRPLGCAYANGTSGDTPLLDHK